MTNTTHTQPIAVTAPVYGPNECLMDDGTHEQARPGHDLCPSCERSMARFRHENAEVAA